MELRSRTERRVDANDNSTKEEKATKGQDPSEGSSMSKTNYIVFIALLVSQFFAQKTFSNGHLTFKLLIFILNTVSVKIKVFDYETSDTCCRVSSK